jgi:hypothetical protein
VYTIEDVRGTRWDAKGQEFFHVYRPADGAPGSTLHGVEWARGNSAIQRRATNALVSLVEHNPTPGSRSPPHRSTVRRLRMQNDCTRCHVANKPTGRFQFERLPPWSTDESGLYTPLHVLTNSAALSADQAFHDPNASDALVTANCPDGEARLHGSRHTQYYQCKDGAAPLGYRATGEGVNEAETYSIAICKSRRYLKTHIDAAGQRHFANAFAECSSVPE